MYAWLLDIWLMRRHTLGHNWAPNSRHYRQIHGHTTQPDIGLPAGPSGNWGPFLIQIRTGTNKDQITYIYLLTTGYNNNIHDFMTHKVKSLGSYM